MTKGYYLQVWIMLSTFLTILFTIVSLLLILLILLQSSRSSGASLFGSSSQTAFGSSSADVLTKITAWLSAGFLTLALGLAYIKSGSVDKDALQEILMEEKSNLGVTPTTSSTEESNSEKKDMQESKDSVEKPKGMNQKGFKKKMKQSTPANSKINSSKNPSSPSEKPSSP